jgi:hypothetical protein
VVSHHSDSTKKFSETDIFNMLEFLIDNIFAMFGGRVFQQTVGMPMGTNCAPLPADLFLYSYEANFIQGLRPICICGILYFKLNGIDAINKITKPRII